MLHKISRAIVNEALEKDSIIVLGRLKGKTIREENSTEN
jgi:IS605 OrfB family transposase